MIFSLIFVDFTADIIQQFGLLYYSEIANNLNKMLNMNFSFVCYEIRLILKNSVNNRGLFMKQKQLTHQQLEKKALRKQKEIAKWEKLPKGQQMMDAFKQGPAPEKTITQEMRQEEFDRYQTTDDHGMHIIGKAKDQNGTPYFIVKNSWNKYNKFGGYFYASYPYMALKTMDIMVHKNAIPKAIRKKLGIN